MSKFSNKEIKEILSKPFQLWPACNCAYCEENGFKREPYEDQRKVFQIPHHHGLDVVLAYGGGRGGKCLQKGTPVIMFDGQVKPVEKIQIGEFVMGPDSKPRLVTDLARGRETMYKVQPTHNGQPFICNESHILSLKKTIRSRDIRINKDGTTYIKPMRYPGEDVVNVSIKEYLTWSGRRKDSFKLYSPGPIDFPNPTKEFSIPPYLLGVWLGDGSSGTANFTTMDPEIVKAIYEWAETIPGNSVKIDNTSGTGKAKTYRITGKIGGDHKTNPETATFRLKELNLISNKHIPHIYKTASQEDRLQLLAGLIDTDGHNSKGRFYEITQKNKTLADDIAFVARSLGFVVNVKDVEKYCTYKGEKRGGTYRRLNICGDLHLIPVRLPRKKMENKGEKFFDQRHRGFTLENLGEGDYYGFSLEGSDGLFLLGDFLVTHNTFCAVSKGIDYALRYPGCTILVGAETRELLKRTAMKEWETRFSINSPWDHPLVARRPNDHQKSLRLKNGTTVWFLHFSDFKELRGIGVSFVHIEEASLIKAADALDECVRRCSETVAPQRQIILTTNPEESKSWVYDTFSLKQFEPGYDGPQLPVGRRCKCQFCPFCLNRPNDPQEFIYKDGKCENCGKKKLAKCPGDIEFMRVVFFDPSRNPHIPADYYQTNKSFTSEAQFNLYTKGQVIELRQGKVYKSYSSRNVNNENVPLDYSKELFWSFDFNVSFQCSVICQERVTPEGVFVDVVDEIVIPEAGPEHVGKEFLARYAKWENDITMYGDPAALNRKVSSNDISQFQTIVNIITNPQKYLSPEEYIELGSPTPKRVKSIPTKIKGQTKVGVKLKVDSVNEKLCNPANEIWLKVNPKCVWLRRSLEDMRWKETTGRDMLDTACDKAAAKFPDKTKVRLLSHPTDALGYYIAKKWPVTKTQETKAFAVVPGQASIEIDGSGEATDSYIKEEEYEPPVASIKNFQEVKQNSLLELLISQGAGDDSISFFDYFG